MNLSQKRAGVVKLFSIQDFSAGYSWVTRLSVRIAGKATHLMKTTLEKVANEQESRTNAEKQAKDKTVKLVSDMSLMKASELLKMAVDDRMCGLFQSESSSKGYGKVKGKGMTQMLDTPPLPPPPPPKSFTASTKTTADHCSEEQVEGFISKKSSPQQELEQKGTQIRQRQRQEQTTRNISLRQEQRKEFGQRQSIESPVLHKRNAKARANTKNITGGEPNNGQMYAY